MEDKTIHMNPNEIFKSGLKKIQESDDIGVNIVMHHMPDPDSMASALGIQELLKTENIESKIFYSGEISHPQNKTMVNLLGLDFKRIDEELKDSFNICVDCTPKNSPCSNAFMVIDHHTNQIKNVEFVINDSKFGACSTIIFEILDSFNFEWDSNETLATGLLLGIRTDTKDLLSEAMHHRDFQAYQKLVNYVDKERVQKIMNYPVPRYVYDKRMMLLKESNFVEKNGIFIGGIEYIPSNQRDVITILADDYLRMEGIHTTVIFCITDEKQMEVSIRTSNSTLDVNQLCNSTFGQFGGGKIDKGGAKVPLNFWSNLNEDSKEYFWKMTCEQMFKSILKEDYIKKEN